jgi:hypothetical protein
MSKKQKRQVSSGAGSNSVGSVEQAVPQRRFSGTTEFNPDYAPVIKGIKRIGLLAGMFIGVLIILTFILK